MTPELIAILSCAVALGALGYQMNRGIRQEIDQFRLEVRTDIGQLRQEVRTDIGQLRQEVRTDIQEVRTDIGQLREDLSHLTERVARIEGLLTPKPWHDQEEAGSGV